MTRNFYGYLFLFLASFICLESKAEIPTISILTCDSGEQLYSTYGHTGVRIRHDGKRYDVVYGYGTFNTAQKGFYLKFMRGKLLYYINAVSFDRFMAEYNRDQRGVVEQILELDSLQTFKMIDFLENNSKPENRYYKYDFFFDNCSTRIRDIFDSEYGVEWAEGATDMTFRDLLDEKQVPLVWSDYGIDLVIGAVADRQSNFSGQMFLPSYMMDILDETTIDGKPLVREKRNLLAFSDVKAERWKVPFITPFKVFCVIFLLFLVAFVFNTEGWSKGVFKYGSFFWFLFLTIVSLIIVFLWFFTDHLATKENWNLIWISPLFLLALIHLRKLKFGSSYSRVLLFGLLGLNILSLVIWSFIPQRWHLAFLPMMLTTIIICLHYLRLHKALAIREIGEGIT
jgi:hypothetical protein